MSGISSEQNRLNPQSNQSSKHTLNEQVFTISETRKRWFERYGANIINVLHSGQHSTVYSGHFGNDFCANRFTQKLRAEKCIQKDLAQSGNKFALKCVNTENNAELKKGVEREIEVILECCYQYIIDAFFIVKFAKSDRYYFFLELADTDLDKYLNNCSENNTKISEMRTKVWISTLCNGLKYLHETGICHQNINSSNILVFNCGQNRSDIHPQLKLADFESALKINPLEMNDTNTVIALQFEDYFNEDILDLYFVFNEILTQTNITDTESDIVYHVINQMINLDDNSITLLEFMLSQTNWPLN